MRTCDTNDDCRDGYECRDLEQMKAHGGEPVLAPGATIDDERAEVLRDRRRTPDVTAS